MTTEIPAVRPPAPLDLALLRGHVSTSSIQVVAGQLVRVRFADTLARVEVIVTEASTDLHWGTNLTGPDLTIDDPRAWVIPAGQLPLPVVDSRVPVGGRWTAPWMRPAGTVVHLLSAADAVVTVQVG